MGCGSFKQEKGLWSGFGFGGGGAIKIILYE